MQLFFSFFSFSQQHASETAEKLGSKSATPTTHRHASRFPRVAKSYTKSKSKLSPKDGLELDSAVFQNFSCERLLSSVVMVTANVW